MAPAWTNKNLHASWPMDQTLSAISIYIKSREQNLTHSTCPSAEATWRGVRPLWSLRPERSTPRKKALFSYKVYIERSLRRDLRKCLSYTLRNLRSPHAAASITCIVLSSTRRHSNERDLFCQRNGRRFNKVCLLL